MKREDYEKRLSNDELKKLSDMMRQVSGWFSQLSIATGLMSDATKEASNTRQSLKRGSVALDLGEFIKRLSEHDPTAAEAVKLAAETRFELGRLHLKFRNERDRATCKRAKWQIETTLKELFNTPFNVHLKNSYVSNDAC